VSTSIYIIMSSSNTIMMEGWIQKKSPSGLAGFHVWQKRWCLLKKESLQYFKEQRGKVPQGTMAFNQISSVALVPASKKAGRFDIVVGDRTYALLADSETLAKLWVEAISKALEAWKKEKSTQSVHTIAAKVKAEKDYKNKEKDFTGTIKFSQSDIKNFSNTMKLDPKLFYDSKHYSDLTFFTGNDNVGLEDDAGNSDYLASCDGSLHDLPQKIVATDTTLQKLVNARILKAAKDPSSSQRAQKILSNPANLPILSEQNLKLFFPTNTHTLRYLLENMAPVKPAIPSHVKTNSQISQISLTAINSPSVPDVLSPTLSIGSPTVATTAPVTNSNTAEPSLHNASENSERLDVQDLDEAPEAIVPFNDNSPSPTHKTDSERNAQFTFLQVAQDLAPPPPPPSDPNTPSAPHDEASSSSQPPAPPETESATNTPPPSATVSITPNQTNPNTPPNGPATNNTHNSAAINGAEPKHPEPSFVKANISCHFPGCSAARLNTSGRRGSITYCDKHKLNIEQIERSMSPEDQEKIELVTTALARIVLRDLTKNDAPFVSALLEVLEQIDERARGLAIRVLWVVMAKKQAMQAEEDIPATSQQQNEKKGVDKLSVKVDENHPADSAAECLSPSSSFIPEVPIEVSVSPARRSMMRKASTHEIKAIELSSNIFAGYMKVYASGKKFCPAVRDALLSLLVYEVDTYARVTERIEKMRLKLRLKNPYAWRAILFALQLTPMDLRESTLMELNTLLIDNQYNCETLRSVGDWQLVIFPLMTDIDARWLLNLGAETNGIGLAVLDTSSKTKVTQISPVIRVVTNVYNYTINILTLMHYNFYMKAPSATINPSQSTFSKVFTRTTDLLIQFCGFAQKPRAMVRALLIALIRKLESNKSSFPPHLYLETPSWQHLFPLLAVVRRFIFNTEMWGNTPIIALENKANSFFVLDELSNFNAKGVVIRFEDLQQWGIHFSSEDELSTTGVCVDGMLNDRLVSFLRALGLHSFDASANPGLSSAEVEFLSQAKEECSFFTDAKVFFELLANLRGDNKGIAKVCQTFCASKNSHERKAILMQLGQLSQRNSLSAKKDTKGLKDRLAGKKAAAPVAGSSSGPITTAQLTIDRKPLSTADATLTIPLNRVVSSGTIEEESLSASLSINSNLIENSDLREHSQANNED
jgi:hypothetical protein